MFLVCGEALFDLFLEEGTGPAVASYAGRAGGSPFNVAVGLARLGAEAGLLTGLSSDLLGRRLASVLAEEGVSTAYAVPTDRPTTISLVGVDPEGVPAYQFYGAGSADTGLAPTDLPALGPDVGGLHFGSYSIAVAPVADAFAALAARESGRFITLDPNVRPTIEPDMEVWRARVGALVPHVDVLKISREDLDLLHPGLAAESFAADMIDRGLRLVVVTDGGETAGGWTAGGAAAQARPPRIEVIDTVGAGDTFMAALTHRLLAASGGPVWALEGLDTAGLTDILGFAARAAAITCSRRGADLPRLADLSD